MRERSTRQQAKLDRCATYYGKVCEKHPELAGLRRTHGGCVECKRKADALYRVKNKQQVRAAIDAWAGRNLEKVRQYVRKAKASNKGRVNAVTAKRRAAEVMRTPKWLTGDDFWMMEQAYALAALRTKMFGFSWHVDHVIPLQGEVVSGLHTPYNLQVIPSVENARKSNKFELT